MTVGRLEFAYMYPMCFYEFLIAINKKQLIDYLGKYNLGQEIAKPIHKKLIELVRLYYL